MGYLRPSSIAAMLFASNPGGPGAATHSTGWVQWAALIAALVAATASVLGALWTTRRSRINSEREEFMRTLRWAAEQTATDNENAQLVGLETLNALTKRSGLHDDDAVMIAAVLQAVNREAIEAYAEGQLFAEEEGAPHD